ncbi:MAG: M14 family zinc carboxypeptidase, partial [Acidobacteriota bacterium]
MKRFPFLLSIALILVPAAPSISSVEDIPDHWLTVAEKNSFEITASHAQTLEFLERAAAESEMIQLTTFGNSGLGRTLPLVIVSKDGLFTPEAAHAAGKPVVLIQSCIHPGEVDGKTASLMMLRDLVLGKSIDLLNAGVILFAPIYNADGHEDVAPTNRANQHGPIGGMGFRTTATGLDLNRDHLKLDSAEAQALASLVNRWQPHLHVDNHVTNGSHHHWILTWSRAEAPQL